MKISAYTIFIISLISGCIDSTSSEKIRLRIISSEFIYEEAPFPSCHASTIVETDNGLLAAWFGGTREKNPDVCIYTSVSKDGKWGDPSLTADGIINDTLRYPCWNPVLFRRHDGDILLFYKVGPSPQEWWGMYKISKDGGKTWSEGEEIPGKMLGPIKNKPVILKDNKILYPTSFETREKWNIYTESSDQVLTGWTKTDIDNNGFNAIQPTILTYKGGRIQMLCRSRERKIVETWSEDQGKTWTAVRATSIPNNNSGIDGVTCKNGLQLLVCNPVEKGRNKLSLLSSTDGKSWNEMLVLEDQPEGEFSYPAIIQGEDGTIHITYTYRREKIKHIQLEMIKK